MVLAIAFGISSWGIFHDIAKFETSDEDYWKEDRISGYWEGWEEGFEEGDWSETYINDKPGVSLALIAGAGLPFVEDLGDYESAGRVGGHWEYLSYEVENSEPINTALRLPVAFFSLAMMGLLVALVWLGTKSPLIAAIYALLLALHPYFLGMSRILNPDTILWPAGMAALLLFWLALQRPSRGYVISAGIFFGLAVASKYTANLLIPMFILLSALVIIFDDIPSSDERAVRTRIRRYLVQLISVVGLGWAIFALLVPAVWQEGRLFLEGTLLSPGLAPILAPLGVVLALLALDAFAFASRGAFFLALWVGVLRWTLLRLAAAAFLVLLALQLVNAWGGELWVPINDIKEITRGEIRNEDALEIFAYPYTAGKSEWFAEVQKLIAQSASTVFAIPGIMLAVLMMGLVRITIRPRIKHPAFVLFALLAGWIFFVGGILSEVFVNARYAILFQGILTVAVAIMTADLLGIGYRRFSVCARHPYRWGAPAIIVVGAGMVGALAGIAPHYTNYQNAALPKTLSLADSWSYGMYEAAQYLNRQPFAEHLEVWSDRDVFCRFFVGKCIKDSSLDLGRITPSHIVVSRRNVMKGHRFHWKYPENKHVLSSEYYAGERFEYPAWETHIGGRPSNYIKVIKLDPELPGEEEIAKRSEIGRD